MTLFTPLDLAMPETVTALTLLDTRTNLLKPAEVGIWSITVERKRLIHHFKPHDCSLGPVLAIPSAPLSFYCSHLAKHKS